MVPSIAALPGLIRGGLSGARALSAAAAPSDNAAFKSAMEKALSGAASAARSSQASAEANSQNPLSGLLNQSTAHPGLNLKQLAGISELNTQLSDLKAQFQAGFRRLLEEQGFDLGAGVNLQVDSSGAIRVTNDHPDKAFIESALNSDSELSNLFREMSSKAGLVQAAEAAQQFQQQYRIDPTTALEEYREQLDKRSQQTFQLTITAEGMEESFTPLPANDSGAIL